MIGKLFKALSRTRESVSGAFNHLLRKNVSAETLEDLEYQLISADLGLQTVEGIMTIVEKHRKENFMSQVEKYLLSILPEKSQDYLEGPGPDVLMVVGVNGTGKTTTAAKLAHFYKTKGKRVLLVAADTYRAAAVEQLKIWSNRVGTDIIFNDKTQQPSAVLFDGLYAAKSKSAEIVIVDTAGRLHTYKNLMIELEKMYRVAENRFSEFSLHSLITLDAGLGQNSLIQAKEFAETIKVDGAILTKMDGTAKGGIIFPLFNELKIPVRFLGLGEDIDDLDVFNAQIYIQSLLGGSPE